MNGVHSYYQKLQPGMSPCLAGVENLRSDQSRQAERGLFNRGARIAFHILIEKAADSALIELCICLGSAPLGGSSGENR